MTSKNCKLNIAELSDVHLGHPNTPTEHIIKNLKLAFPDNAETGELDMIVIAGDLFDRLLNLPDDNVRPIRIWINYLLRMCKRRDIVVRVLEGTPSHDWKQSAMFPDVNEIAEIGADCVFVQTLSIEYIERFGINVLYVPDEWRVNPDDTWVEVLTLLQQHHLEKVDFAFMHGSFQYQLPMDPRSHLQERYLSIVRYAIFIGHVHQYSEFELIFSAGSFDRLTHGDENAKGHLRYKLFDDDTYTLTFVENVGARIYKTIECFEMDGEKLHKTVEAVIKTLPKKSAVRIKSDKSEVASAALKHFKEKYPDFDWIISTEGKALKRAEELLLKRRTYKTITVTKDNIVPLIMERIRVKHPDHAVGCERLLIGIINGEHA